MQKWDYETTVCSHRKLDETLELCGDDGWELVTSTFLNGTYNLIFKRPNGKVDL